MGGMRWTLGGVIVWLWTRGGMGYGGGGRVKLKRTANMSVMCYSQNEWQLLPGLPGLHVVGP